MCRLHTFQGQDDSGLCTGKDAEVNRLMCKPRKLSILKCYRVTEIRRPCHGLVAGSSSQRSEFNHRVVDVGFVVDEVALEWVLFQVRHLYLVSCSYKNAPHLFVQEPLGGHKFPESHTPQKIKRCIFKIYCPCKLNFSTVFHRNFQIPVERYKPGTLIYSEWFFTCILCMSSNVKSSSILKKLKGTLRHDCYDDKNVEENLRHSVYGDE